MRATVCVVEAWPMGHRLQNHSGKCRGIHGHTYRLQATFSGEVCDDATSSDHGMVVDFSALRRMVRAKVVEPLDHALVLEEGDPAVAACRPYAKVVELAWPPTAEALASWLLVLLQVGCRELGVVNVVGVRVWESADTCAEAVPE